MTVATVRRFFLREGEEKRGQETARKAKRVKREASLRPHFEFVMCMKFYEGSCAVAAGQRHDGRKLCLFSLAWFTLRELRREWKKEKKKKEKKKDIWKKKLCNMAEN